MMTDATRKKVKKLHQKKYRYESGSFIIEGLKNVQEACAHGHVELLMVHEDGAANSDIAACIESARACGADIIHVNQKDIKALKTTETFPGVMAVARMQRADVGLVSGTVLYLDHVSDPGNLGTIIRTADWFGVQHVILSHGCVDPYNPKAVRGSMGSMFRVTLHQQSEANDMLTTLKKHGYRLAAFTLNGEPLRTLSVLSDHPLLCVFGSESHGLSQDIVKHCDAQYTISGAGTAESLNVAVSVGIALAHITNNAVSI
jgi:RNA methyltransferase, TrmH family